VMQQKRVVICWPGFSGYLAACWRALASDPGIDLMVVVAADDQKGQAPFDARLLDGLPVAITKTPQGSDYAEVYRAVVSHRPDCVAIGGWFVPAFRRLAYEPELEQVRFVLGMDTPWRGAMRQRLGTLLLRRYIRRMWRVIVASERAWHYAVRLGVHHTKIRRGLYGADCASFNSVWRERLNSATAWPRSFLYVGRYASEKGLDTLLEAYRRYREAVDSPWPLTCCGRGQLSRLLENVAGITDRGFVQPGQQPPLFAEHGVFVLPSHFEPWGVVIPEAAAAGLPVICSDACGAGLEVVRSYYNGMTVATGSAADLCRALKWMHHHFDELPILGERAHIAAQPLAAEHWARRWREIFTEVD
jgi:glycosyltransferase involved in cell wall biosynthesis